MKNVRELACGKELYKQCHNLELCKIFVLKTVIDWSSKSIDIGDK